MLEMRSTYDPTRWAEIGLAICDDRLYGRFLEYTAEFESAIEPADELAASYQLENWKSGVLSRVFDAYRSQHAERKPVILTTLRGHLGSDNMTQLALAAKMATTQLLGGETGGFDTQDWVARVKSQESDVHTS